MIIGKSLSLIILDKAPAIFFNRTNWNYKSQWMVKHIVTQKIVTILNLPSGMSYFINLMQNN